jgi:hypothetical protein
MRDSRVRIFEFCRLRRIPEFVRVKIEERERNAVFYFARAEIMQERSPLRVLLEIIRDAFRNQNVTGVTAIHHPLRDIDPGPSDIPLLTQVGYFLHRPAVNSHAHPQFGMLLQFTRDLDGAFHRRFRTGPKHQRAAVARWQAHQFPRALCGAKRLSCARDLAQLLQMLELLVN